ncbi:MAG: acetyl-CoA carboxylase carboxyl transferase subunit alpha [Candidatus Pelagibacter sp. TMED275]|nr:MAG: acetyl-CoA carboxylase carboxyl transferase subunit alpha [Candidatus Pelagibacter sp. TMED275]
MNKYLEFEKNIEKLEDELKNLKDPFNNEGLTKVETEKITILENEIDEKLKKIYQNLNPWEKTQVARHEDRPKANFFINQLFEDFVPLEGDRFYSEDKSITTGFAKFNNISVLVLGQEKGEDLNTRIEKNFGMMRPEGYRKSVRLMKLADKFNIPIIIFIDTPGAYPGAGAEERGQAEAIAKSIQCSMEIKVPTISVIIGEGGSGGAIALASSNKVLMLENAIYSVISPEGCATILWRDPSKTLQAATAMKLSANDLLKLGIIDEIILEPSGGAHRNKYEICKNIKISLEKNLLEMLQKTREENFLHRKNKFLSIGRQKGFQGKLQDNTLIIKQKFYDNYFIILKKYKYYIILFLLCFLIVSLL